MEKRLIELLLEENEEVDSVLVEWWDLISSAWEPEHK